MPIEKEWKFVLFSARAALKVATLCLPAPLRIEQGYLEPGTRVRRVQSETGTKHFFTWKRKLRTGEPMEIEPPISLDDYRLLKEECPASLVKDRWELPLEGCGGKWDMDAFLDEQGFRCFWMAEVETHPDNQWKTGEMHPMLDGLVAWAVPYEHPAFFNYALCQPGGIDRAKAVVADRMVLLRD